MNINKRLDRVKQWAGEKMGAETKTNVSEDFRCLEQEMALRQEGMDRLHKSMTAYVKSLSKHTEAEDKEKLLPVGYLGQSMTGHGEDFEPDSEFGNCLIAMGRANEKIARLQETYMAHATATWLEGLERSLAQMKEYQSARKKLESRRLAYDTSITKMQKAKREDFRVEEELRSQKAKYEEASEDVLRRMEDIKEAEAESVADLSAFVDAELEYYDRCRDELMRLKREWPAAQNQGSPRDQRRTQRSRSNTAHSYSERYSTYEEPAPEPEALRPSIRSAGRVQSSSRLSVQPEYPESPSRPQYGRAQTFQGPTSIYREVTPVGARHGSIANDPAALRSQLRPTTRINTNNDLFSDPSDDSATMNSASPDRSWGARSVSPATSHDSAMSRTTSSTGISAATGNARKGPPPPPPSRAKKPPPPPPMKRADISATSVNRY